MLLQYQGSDIVELAANYMAGLLQNHPFLDGNKRTGEFASGRIDEAGLLAFLRANVEAG
jgi:death-on-curing protein